MKYTIGVSENDSPCSEIFVRNVDDLIILYPDSTDRESVEKVFKEITRIVNLAESLVIALVDGVTFHGDENCVEAALVSLKEMREFFEL